MNRLNEKGLTLVETAASVALLAMLMATLLPVAVKLHQSTSQIVSDTNTNKLLYTAQLQELAFQTELTHCPFSKQTSSESEKPR